MTGDEAVAMGAIDASRINVAAQAVGIGRAALEAWSAEQEGLKAALRDATRKHSQQKIAELRQSLAEHEQAKPAEIVAPRLRYEDVNPQSLAGAIATGTHGRLGRLRLSHSWHCASDWLCE